MGGVLYSGIGVGIGRAGACPFNTCPNVPTLGSGQRQRAQSMPRLNAFGVAVTAYGADSDSDSDDMALP